MLEYRDVVRKIRYLRNDAIKHEDHLRIELCDHVLDYVAQMEENNKRMAADMENYLVKFHDADLQLIHLEEENLNLDNTLCEAMDKIEDLEKEIKRSQHNFLSLVSTLEHRNRALKIAAGKISTCKGYTDRHPQDIYNELLKESEND